MSYKIISVTENNMFPITLQNLQQKMLLVVFHRDLYLGCYFLYYIYMNNISYTSRLLNTILFADDITVFYSHEDMSVLCHTINSEIKEVSNWFKANKLSLNAKKTNLMYLGTWMQTKKITENNNYDI